MSNRLATDQVMELVDWIRDHAINLQAVRPNNRFLAKILSRLISYPVTESNAAFVRRMAGVEWVSKRTPREEPPKAAPEQPDLQKRVLQLVEVCAGILVRLERVEVVLGIHEDREQNPKELTSFPSPKAAEEYRRTLEGEKVALDPEEYRYPEGME